MCGLTLSLPVTATCLLIHHAKQRANSRLTRNKNTKEGVGASRLRSVDQGRSPSPATSPVAGNHVDSARPQVTWPGKRTTSLGKQSQANVSRGGTPRHGGLGKATGPFLLSYCRWRTFQIEHGNGSLEKSVRRVLTTFLRDNGPQFREHLKNQPFQLRVILDQLHDAGQPRPPFRPPNRTQ